MYSFFRLKEKLWHMRLSALFLNNCSDNTMEMIGTE